MKYSVYLISLFFIATACGEEVFFDDLAQLEVDRQIIDNFLEQEGILTQSHESGLRYEILNEGTGNFFSLGDSVHLVIGRLDGQELLNNIGRRPVKSVNWSYTIEANTPRNFRPRAATILLDELRLGSVVKLYVPSGLGFGYEGRTIDGYEIGSNTNLIIELRVSAGT